MNTKTGKALSGIAHLKQSIIDILTTPIGSRVMRRDYGSRLYQLLDRPMTSDFTMELFGATAEALAQWEPRLRLDRVVIGDDTDVANGRISLNLTGTYRPNGKLITLDGIMV